MLQLSKHGAYWTSTQMKKQPVGPRSTVEPLPPIGGAPRGGRKPGSSGPNGVGSAGPRPSPEHQIAMNGVAARGGETVPVSMATTSPRPPPGRPERKQGSRPKAGNGPNVSEGMASRMLNCTVAQLRQLRATELAPARVSSAAKAGRAIAEDEEVAECSRYPSQPLSVHLRPCPTSLLSLSMAYPKGWFS